MALGHLHRHIPCSTIHNGPDMETASVFRGWMNETWQLLTRTSYLSLKKKTLPFGNNTDEPRGCYVK